MKTLFIFSSIVLYHVSLCSENLHSSGQRRLLPGEAPDAVKVFEAFPSVVLVSDPSNGTMLDCLKAYRSELNTELRTVTYTWILPKIGHTVPLYVKAGDNPGAFTYTAGNGK
ncbi:hypothetical protein MTO96_007715 [Rhipicephalus appendiculatus]